MSGDVSATPPRWPPKIGDLYEVRRPTRVHEPAFWFLPWGVRHTAFSCTPDLAEALSIAFAQQLSSLVLNARRID